MFLTDSLILNKIFHLLIAYMALDCLDYKKKIVWPAYDFILKPLVSKNFCFTLCSPALCWYIISEGRTSSLTHPEEPYRQLCAQKV
jgi:hypothetical protein